MRCTLSSAVCLSQDPDETSTTTTTTTTTTTDVLLESETTWQLVQNFIEKSCGESGFGRTESTVCTEHPECETNELNCDQFWGEWSDCDRVCPGTNPAVAGEQRRTFEVPAGNDSDSVYRRRYAEEVCATLQYVFPSRVASRFGYARLLRDAQ